VKQSAHAKRRAMLRMAALALPATAGGLAPAMSAPGATGGGGGGGGKADDPWPQVLPGQPLVFPRDHGAHPDFRTEWWYITGWLQARAERAIGVQITFFRSRTRHDRRNPSRFAPVQLLFAHGALASPERGRLAHAERSARAGFGLATYSERDLELAIGDWRLWRTPEDRIAARLHDPAFDLDLLFSPVGPPVLQGEAGFSRKGPEPTQASWYYSRPQLVVSGRIRGPDRSPGREVTGRAWLDHEWSSEILDRQAAGWDWVGLNFDNGSALMAFRIRRRDGGVLWSHARWIVSGKPTSTPSPEFTPLRLWRSPRTDASWPVAMRLRVGSRLLQLEPLFDDQEIDASASTGTVYWEGAVRVLEAGRQVGAGYLELTGYAGSLSL
jgi:predicted secreted hydrolase